MYRMTTKTYTFSWFWM